MLHFLGLRSSYMLNGIDKNNCDITHNKYIPEKDCSLSWWRRLNVVDWRFILSILENLLPGENPVRNDDQEPNNLMIDDNQPVRHANQVKSPIHYFYICLIHPYSTKASSNRFLSSKSGTVICSQQCLEVSLTKSCRTWWKCSTERWKFESIASWAETLWCCPLEHRQMWHSFMEHS